MRETRHPSTRHLGEPLSVYLKKCLKDVLLSRGRRQMTTNKMKNNPWYLHCKALQATFPPGSMSWADILQTASYTYTKKVRKSSTKHGVTWIDWVKVYADTAGVTFGKALRDPECSRTWKEFSGTLTNLQEVETENSTVFVLEHVEKKCEDVRFYQTDKMIVTYDRSLSKTIDTHLPVRDNPSSTPTKRLLFVWLGSLGLPCDGTLCDRFPSHSWRMFTLRHHTRFRPIEP